MILLDTNVISEFMKPVPEPRVVRWLDKQPRSSIWTTSITILEIRTGLLTQPDGRKRELRVAGFQYLLSQKLARRVAGLDLAAAEHTANLIAARSKAGHPVDLRDSMIAGIALAANASIATRNIRHFEDLQIQLIDPWMET